MKPSTARRFRRAGYQFKPQEVDQHDDPSYQQLVEDMAKLCRCFPLSDRPCDGLMAGGPCDQLGQDREFYDPVRELFPDDQESRENQL